MASVIGRSFDAAALAAAHPSHPEAQELESHLDALARLDLVVESEPGSFDFRHAVTRETAYDLLPFDLRRRIHRSVAGFLESHGEQERELNYPLLAYHWDRGDNHRNALGYYERTGASSLRKGANLEAIEAHSRSLELFARHREELADIGVLRRSQWHLEIAQAEEALSNFDEAEKRLYQALDLLDVKVGSGTGRPYDGPGMGGGETARTYRLAGTGQDSTGRRRKGKTRPGIAGGGAHRRDLLLSGKPLRVPIAEPHGDKPRGEVR